MGTKTTGQTQAYIRTKTTGQTQASVGTKTTGQTQDLGTAEYRKDTSLFIGTQSTGQI